MKKINIVELLKDCPKGIELDCSMYDNLYFDCIREHPIYPIVCYTIDSKGEENEITFDWYGKYAQIDTAKCVIFPKGKTSWEGFHRPFKDGDIIACDTEKGAQLFIFKENIYNYDYVQCYMMLDCGGEIDFEIGDYYVERFATEEEKEKLFQAIKDNGYKWNPETKTLEKLVEPQFNVGDWIIRNNKYTGIPVKVIEFNGYYSCELNGEVVNLTRNDVHNNFHLWTIQDAKDGDVLVDKDNNIGIFQKFEGIYWYSYIYLGCDGELRGFSIGGSHKQTDVHPATKEQRDLLFQKIKEAGYCWNDKTKTLEKLIIPKFKVGDKVRYKNNHNVVVTITNIEKDYYACGTNKAFWFTEQNDYELVPKKFDITTLKPFDKVLVRYSLLEKWRIQFFEKYDKTYQYPFICIGCNKYRQCIPYEGNEHLHDKTDDCKDFYKTW